MLSTSLRVEHNNPSRNLANPGVAANLPRQEKQGNEPERQLPIQRREGLLERHQKTHAREEMNHFLRDAGITRRSLTLIDAMIMLWTSLETETPTTPAPPLGWRGDCQPNFQKGNPMTRVFDPDDDVIRPSSNQVQEAIRWMPNGVKLYLINLPRRDRITGITPAMRAWLEEHHLIEMKTRAGGVGRLRLTEHGLNVQKTLVAKLGGA